MDPEWIYWEKALRPFRKKDTKFEEVWPKKVKIPMSDGTKIETTCEDAFKKIRGMLSRDSVLRHVDMQRRRTLQPQGVHLKCSLMPVIMDGQLS